MHVISMVTFIFTFILLIIFVLLGLKLYSRLTCGAYQITSDLTGKIYLITGATAGIGLETATELARHGGTVYMLCRNVVKGKRCAKKIHAETGQPVDVIECNLSSFKSIRNCVDKIDLLNINIDVLINNAGVGGFSDETLFHKTVDGIAEMMQANHFGHFLLTNLLLDRLQRTPNARIVNVSSMMHEFANDFDVNDMNNEYSGKSYIGLYSWSKLANVLFTRGLARRLDGTELTVNSLHPGAIATDIGLPRHRSYNWFETVVSTIGKRFLSFTMKTSFEGAQTQIYLAVSKEVEYVTGQYFSDCKPKSTALKALDDQLVEDLWKKSVELTGLQRELY